MILKNQYNNILKVHYVWENPCLKENKKEINKWTTSKS